MADFSTRYDQVATQRKAQSERREQSETKESEKGQTAGEEKTDAPTEALLPVEVSGRDTEQPLQGTKAPLDGVEAVQRSARSEEVIRQFGPSDSGAALARDQLSTEVDFVAGGRATGASHGGGADLGTVPAGALPPATAEPNDAARADQPPSEASEQVAGAPPAKADGTPSLQGDTTKAQMPRPSAAEVQRIPKSSTAADPHAIEAGDTEAPNPDDARPRASDARTPAPLVEGEPNPLSTQTAGAAARRDPIGEAGAPRPNEMEGLADPAEEADRTEASDLSSPKPASSTAISGLERAEQPIAITAPGQHMTQVAEPVAVSLSDRPASEPLPLDRAGPQPLPSAQPLATPQPNAQHLVAQIADVARGGSDGTIEVSLRPEELGRVRLVFSGEGASMTVSLTTERPETLDLLRRNIDLLGSELRDLGYGTLSFDFGTEDDQRARDAPLSPTVDAQTGADEISGEQDAQVKLRLAPGGSGRLDLRL